VVARPDGAVHLERERTTVADRPADPDGGRRRTSGRHPEITDPIGNRRGVLPGDPAEHSSDRDGVLLHSGQSPAADDPTEHVAARNAGQVVIGDDLRSQLVKGRRIRAQVQVVERVGGHDGGS
jgi:hypothetical protein